MNSISYKWRALLLLGFAWLVCFPAEVISIFSHTKDGTIIWAICSFLLVVLSPVGGYYLGKWFKQRDKEKFHRMTDNRFKL